MSMPLNPTASNPTASNPTASNPSATNHIETELTKEKQAEYLTLGVLMSGVAALALSDFVSVMYWMLPTTAALLRLWRGSSFALSEMHASFIGWFGFLWVGLELILGRAWVVAFTDFLLILALAVTIEAATPRNHLHRMLTGLFLMLAGAVLTDSVLYALPLTALMWFIWRAAACLYGLEQVGGHLPVASVRKDMRSNVLMLVITLSIFLMFPRFDIQSKLQPTQPRMQTTGFSDQVQLGDFARNLDSTVVMRIEDLDANTTHFRQQIMGRYWRGVVLSQYHHFGWKQRPAHITQTWLPEQVLTFSKTSKQTIRIAMFREASDHPYIMLPNGITGIQPLQRASSQDDLKQLHFSHAPNRRLRLVMQIAPLSSSRVVQSQTPPQASESNPHVPEFIQTWVHSTVASGTPPAQALQQLNNTLHRWTYDLNAPLDAKAPLASFLRLKRGHCELYATTLALAARSLGIPARVVNGYFGGEWNDTGKFLIIRQQHAHSWVEVWQHGHWQRMDPTPASRWSITNKAYPEWDQLWETVKLSWYRYILEFQNQDREALFKAVMAWLSSALPWLLLSVFCIFLIYRIQHFLKPRQTSQKLNRHQRVIDRWLEQHGIQHQTSEPLRSITAPQNIASNTWQAWVATWEKSIYCQTTLPSIRQLKKQLKSLEK